MSGYHPKGPNGERLDVDEYAEQAPVSEEGDLFADDAIIDLGGPFAPLPPVYGDDGEEIICLDRDPTPPDDLPW